MEKISNHLKNFLIDKNNNQIMHFNERETGDLLIQDSNNPN